VTVQNSGRRRPLRALGEWIHRRFRLVLVVAALATITAGVFGADVAGKLLNGGYTPEHSESANAEALLGERFRDGTPNLVVLARAEGALEDPTIAAAGLALHERIAKSPEVTWVHSFWADQNPALRSDDGRSALFAVRLAGDEDTAQRAARTLVDTWQRDAQGFTLSSTGEARVNGEVVDESERDLLRAELIAAPITALILLIVFGTPLAALLPVLVGAVAVSLNLALLSAIADVTDVSLFALNITTALGFGLAVDYSLFVVTRYREELAAGASERDAVVTAVGVAGRTVLFSVVTVALSLVALLLFPLMFLRSLAYAAIPITLIAGVVSVTVLPALLMLTGRHLNRFDVMRRIRGPRDQVTSPGWRRWANAVMRRPLLTGIPVVILLLLVATPFSDVRFGLTDERVLPAAAQAHQTATEIDRDFSLSDQTTLQVVLRGSGPEVGEYADRLSALPGITAVAGPDGVHQGGVLAVPQPAPRRVAGDTWLTVTASMDRYSEQAENLVHAVRSTPAPAEALVGGDPAVLVDTKAVLGERLPLAGLVIALSTLVLLFLFTGSLLVPIKALVLNLLSLTASFGAMVYVFQEGHLRWLVGEFTATGYLEVTIPVLMFCIAFGLSMDYEVFLLGRIREEYDRHHDNTKAVAFGLERTGRLFTAAALIVACVLVALATSGLSLLKLLGVGLALAVIVDAVLIRGVLVPAFMRLMGRANWWMPRFLVPVYRMFALREHDGKHDGEHDDNKEHRTEHAVMSPV
jgi:putative drug exporter of the RND superfamily